jgi:hypothetical protein
MFWNKKRATATLTKEPEVKQGANPPAVKVETTPKLKAEKLPGPRNIPNLVEKELVSKYKVDTDLVQLLKAVVCKRPQRETEFDCRVFDQSEADARQVQIRDYNSLDEHPDLVLYEGWFDEGTKHAEMAEKNKPNFDVPLFTENEINQKIEALTEAGSTVFFYQARGPGRGGPLGMGAAIIELNPDYLRKKGKKYNVFTDNVINMQPAGKKQKLFDSNKSKEIAHWVKEAHHKRMYS